MSIERFFKKRAREESCAEETFSAVTSTSKESVPEEYEKQFESEDKQRKTDDSSSTVKEVSTTLEKPHQSKNFPFPKSSFGKYTRSFQGTWFTEYPWLHYDEEKDAAFCYICINQSAKRNLQSARNTEKAFISVGFSNWKKALLRFKQHQQSDCHKVAVDHEINIPRSHADIIDLTNEAAKRTRMENRRCFAKIIESLQYLSKQGIAIRGDDDENSNFTQLLKLRGKDDACLAKWLETKGDRYTSHAVQNEILAIMAKNVLRDLVSYIGDSYFSIICDECTDISNKEQLTFCLRWLDECLDAHEDFLGFYQVKNIEAKTITSAINDILTRLQLSLACCRGQCYDGASNMLGKKTGVARQIQAVQPKAVSTHCHAHSLSLGVKDTVKKCKLLSDAMSTAKEIVTLIKYSPKREAILGNIKESVDEGENSDEYKIGGVLKLCPTRWTVSADCFDRILENYASLFRTWEVCLGTKLQTDIRARILGCESQMKTFDFFFGLHLGKRIFAHTDNLSKTLQSPRLSATESQHIAGLTLASLESIRNETSFDAFYDLVLLKMKEQPGISEPTVPRKRRAPARFEQGMATPEYPETARDHYRKLFYEAMDLAIASIRDRFNQPAFKVYASMESLLLKASKGEDISMEIDELKVSYEQDVNIGSLSSQLTTFKIIMKDKDLRCFKDVLDALKDLRSSERQLINHVITVAKLIHVNPATSSTGERSFSTARRIKTWVRSTMSQERFNHLSFLNTHKKRLENLKLEEVANEFSILNENRQRNFGKFVPADFKR